MLNPTATKNIERETFVRNFKRRYWIQIKLLLWKNWLLRKRNKCRTIIEVLWPLTMILLVVFLHQVGEKTFVDNCHLKAKAMPSSGEILFLQSLFCTINNTCDSKQNATMPCFNYSLVSNLEGEIQESFNLEPSMTVSKEKMKNRIERSQESTHKFESWVKDFFVLESLIEALKNHQSKSMNESLLKNYSDPNMCKSAEFSAFDNFKEGTFDKALLTFKTQLNDFENKSDLFNLSRIKTKIYFAGLLNSFYQIFQNRMPNEKIDMQSNIEQSNILDYLFCGPNVPQIKCQIKSLVESGKRKSRESEETMEPGDSNYIVEEPEWEYDTTEFCNNLMSELESSYSSRVIFRLFKPLIRGKLIYTPNAPVINRLMGRINTTLSNIRGMIDLLKSAKEMSQEMYNINLEDIINKYKNDDAFIQDIIESEAGKRFFKYFANDTDNSDMNNKTKTEQKKKIFLRNLDRTLENWKDIFLYSNNTKDLASLIPYLECIDPDRIIGMRDENLAVQEALHWLNQERLWGLIVFVNVSLNDEELKPSVTYKIRTGIERTPDTNLIRDRVYAPRVKRNVIYDLREITGGFAYLQNMIEGEIIKEYTGRKYVPGIYLKQTPYPCHTNDSFSDVITRTFPMFMVISWIYMFCMMSKRIVHEKEILFKGTLRIFGVTTSQHWISWFIDAIIPMVIVTSLISVLLVKGGLIPNSDIFLTWLFLTTFALPTVTLAFLVSTFFCKANFAMAVSGMIYFLLYLPYPPIQNFGEAINPYFKAVSCLISNVAFGLGCTWIANMEEIGVGAQLSRINYSPIPGNPITMCLIIEMFLIDSLIYLLLAIYFDNVFAANDFVRQRWYYCLTSSYWKKKPAEYNVIKKSSFVKVKEENSLFFEKEPEGLRVGIEVINISKEFGRTKKKVINNLSLNFYEDQITSFLGPNGAGKTTAISMMIGLLPVTEGTVRIYGVDVKKDAETAVKDIGICRQENVLLDDLTVEEHFKLFAKLKNNSEEAEVDNNLRKMLRDLQLGHRAKQPVKILSGGTKRKVCVAMAFIGGSRTVFLDEPTAGIDPYSRRSIWELLLKYKKGRTIILTTHFLDEADLLGDRIAIISSGELQCCGSSIFLKSNFGKGYYLTIESNIRSGKISSKPKKLLNESEYSAQVEDLSNLIKKIIPSAEFYEHVASEIIFLLPSYSTADEYNTLFTELEKNKEKLNFSSYGISDTTLEEVLTQVLLQSNKAKEKKNIFVENLDDCPANDKIKSQESENITRVSSTYRRIRNLNIKTIFTQHFTALIIKRFLHHIRNFKIILIEIVLPTLFMAIALALAKTLPALADMPPLVIDISAYSPSSIFYTNNLPDNPLISSYEQTMLGPYGLGSKCVLQPEKCSLKNIPRSSMVIHANLEDRKECSCSKGFFDCNKEPLFIKPPHAPTSEGDFLYNLTNLNLTNWLISTEFDYSAQRIGGISFGYFTSFTGMSVEEFLNLFMFKKFINILQNFLVGENILIDPEILTSLIMTTSCNKSYGEKLFKDRNFGDNIIIWFNNRGRIASLALMNAVSNIVLRASLPNNTDPSNYSIRLIDHPLPMTKRQLEDQIELQTNIALLCALSVIWALSFIPAMYSVYLVEERMSGLKHLELVSGISRTVYWCTNLFWDIISYSVSILAITLLYFFFQMIAFVGRNNVGAFILLLYSYGFVNITFVFVTSFLFASPTNAFIFIACWNILCGVATLLSTFTLTLISSEENPYYLNTIFMVFPQFCFGKALINMALEGVRAQALGNFGIKPISKSFDWHLTTKYIFLMFFMGLSFFILTLLIEYGIFQSLFFVNFLRNLSFSKKAEIENFERDEDDDVKNERKRVESDKAKKDGDILIINNLTKVYSKRGAPAVDRISIGVKRGECFGLLGLNGAGKTTVFKMLTGCLSPTQGDATIGGFSITKDPMRSKLLIGYCPQVNALDPYLTADEHLSFFCRIRGVTGAKKEKEISLNIERLGLTEQRNKIVKVLSGGNKRKVNTAIAFVCNPELILLDEPTSGMDVLSRRFLWNSLQDVVQEGRCVVLTSHSMEECQALCTHLSIMVNGRFTCFGSSQHLKNKFNEGYNVTVRLYRVSEISRVSEFFEKNFPNFTLVHIQHLQMKYKLNSEIFIGSIFRIMNKAKEEKLIQDYSISQTTLESIFLKLAKTSEDANETSSKSTKFEKAVKDYEDIF